MAAAALAAALPPAAAAALSQLLSPAAWLANPWLVWGLGPMLALNAGFFGAAGLMELLLWTRWFDSALLVYPSAASAPAKGASRRELAAGTQARIPWLKQLRGCIYTLAGHQAVINGVTLALLMRWAAPQPASWLPASLAEGLWQFVAMAVIGDFGLYWGHRVQHEFPLLWKAHRVHHSIDTPTPFSTLYIHGVDAALQGGIPFALASALVRPAPLVLYANFAARVAENAFNHSGLDSGLVDVLGVKFLPLRAPAAHHDAHHKYSNHCYNAKNYGESFWIWDWMFGTLSPLSGHKQGSARKQA